MRSGTGNRVNGILMSARKNLGSLRLARNAIPWKSTAKRLRSAGDRARDNRDWASAIEHYRAYLARVPNDAPIWVQYGHALKESDKLAESEAAYRKAIALHPGKTDAHVHLADLLKRQGRSLEVAQLFLDLLKSAPNAEAVRELEQAGFGYQARVAFEGRPDGVPANGIFIELKDLFQYLSLHSTVTGITRVTLGLINYILHEMPGREAERYQFVHHYGSGEGLLLVSREKMRAIVRAAMHESPDLTAMQTLIQDIRSTSKVFRLDAGDTYLIVGAFWEFADNPSWIGGMRQRGVTVGAYIYDLIPITHAQYCTQGLTDAFSIAFAEVARMLDFALTISAFVADEVRQYLKTYDVKPFPVVPVPLAHELRFRGEVEKPAYRTPATSKRKYLAGVPFVLCVCTIEARKNHIYLFTIWQKMLEARMDVPDLVFVGRPGWRVETLMQQVEESNSLNGRLHILYGLSDDELADLYDRCLFTAFPSFVEGWGLPVGESLAHGKLCVASSSSSIPEVGGDSAIYIDPVNVDEGFAVFSKLLSDPDELSRMEDELRNSFKPRTWVDVGRDFFAAVHEILADLEREQPERRLFAPSVAAARLLETAKIARPTRRGRDYAFNPERLVFARGWRAVEPTGTWMLDPEAVLIMRTDLDPSAEVSIVLHLGASPWVGAQHVLNISTGGGGAGRGSAQFRRPLKAEADFWVTIKGRVDDEGLLKIHFKVTGAVEASAGSAPVTVRVRAVGYAPLANPEARVELLERALLA